MTQLLSCYLNQNQTRRMKRRRRRTLFPKNKRRTTLSLLLKSITILIAGTYSDMTTKAVLNSKERLRSTLITS